LLGGIAMNRTEVNCFGVDKAGDVSATAPGASVLLMNEVLSMIPAQDINHPTAASFYVVRLLRNWLRDLQPVDVQSTTII
jgi:hypothetical protein